MHQTPRRSRRPQYLNPLELIDFARFYADEVMAGEFPYVDFDPGDRWHRRIYRDPRVDVWLISWLPEQGTALHDHGGSSGAFTVLSGVLTEAVFSGLGLRELAHPIGNSVGFGPHYVHDVRNLGDAPAVSVHAYSAPLTSMTYYGVDGGNLVPHTTVQTDDPEPLIEIRAAS